MDRDKLKLMRAYLEAALTGFEEHFGVHVSIGNISYTTNNCKIALNVAEIKERACFDHFVCYFLSSPE